MVKSVIGAHYGLGDWLYNASPRCSWRFHHRIAGILLICPPQHYGEWRPRCSRTSRCALQPSVLHQPFLACVDRVRDILNGLHQTHVGAARLEILVAVLTGRLRSVGDSDLWSS